MSPKTRAHTRIRKKPSSVDDLFGGGVGGNMLHPDYDRKAVYAWFQKRHLKGHTLLDDRGVYHTLGHEWRVPYGVREALKVHLTHNQMVVKYPFYVTWQSPRTGKRFRKYVMSITAGIHLIATRVQYVDPNACIVSRTVGYHVPPKLRGKFPRHMNGVHVYWCPACMDARRFRRVQPLQEFYAIKKVWSEEKMRYIFADRKLALLECPLCGITNRDHRFRTSNQPYEVRKIKKGVRRVKKRRKSR